MKLRSLLVGLMTALALFVSPKRKRPADTASAVSARLRLRDRHVHVLDRQAGQPGRKPHGRHEGLLHPGRPLEGRFRHRPTVEPGQRRGGNRQREHRCVLRCGNVASVRQGRRHRLLRQRHRPLPCQYVRSIPVLERARGRDHTACRRDPGWPGLHSGCVEGTCDDSGPASAGPATRSRSRSYARTRPSR